MDIKLDFDSEEIAKKLHEAIINSTFEKLFTDAVKVEIQRLSETSWSAQNIVSSVVKDYVRQAMRDILESEYKETILKMVRAKITDERLDKLASELADKIIVESRY